MTREFNMTEPIHACFIIDDMPANATYWMRRQQEAFGYNVPDTGWGKGWRELAPAPKFRLEDATALADLVETFGLRGKCTVLPCPAGLGRIDSPMVVPVMERVLREESPHAYAAQMEVLASLHRNPRPQLLNAVAALLADGPGGRRTKAAETLGAFKDERAIEPLIQLLEKTDGDLYYAKKAAMFALEDITGYDGAEPGKGGGGESAEKWRKILERK